MTRFTNAQIEKALREQAALPAAAAQALGCSRQLVWSRIQRSPHLQAVCKDVEETLKDLAEGTVVSLIKAEDGATVRWYLERKGKDRGYANKTELGFSDEAVASIVSGLGGDLERLRAARARLAEAAEA